MATFLLIDDDAQLGPPLATYFQRFDLTLVCALRPSVGLARLRVGGIDAAILDVMLPEMDGFELCRIILRDSNLPVIMLTARGDVMERAVGLELGADDYLPKPFEPRQLVARLQTVLRWREVSPAPLARLLFDGLGIDPDTRSVLRNGSIIDLTSTEFDLLFLLAKDAGKVFSRDDNLNSLRDHDVDLFYACRGHCGQSLAKKTRAFGRHQNDAQCGLCVGAGEGGPMSASTPKGGWFRRARHSLALRCTPAVGGLCGSTGRRNRHAAEHRTRAIDGAAAACDPTYQRPERQLAQPSRHRGTRCAVAKHRHGRRLAQQLAAPPDAIARQRESNSIRHDPARLGHSAVLDCVAHVGRTAGLTALAYVRVRRLLRPLDDIRAGALRFGSGEFAVPIAVRHKDKPDELGELAESINPMGSDIQQMLDAKQALLLAISYELRSPLTRARLNTELLPETAGVQPGRNALLRELGAMRELIADLLESERLASARVSLHRERVDLPALALMVIESLLGGSSVTTAIGTDVPALSLDSTRIRVLLRNLLDNALCHGVEAERPPVLSIHKRDDTASASASAITAPACLNSSWRIWPSLSTVATPPASAAPVVSGSVCICAS